MGIAGALASALQINQIYGIRHVYREYHDESDHISFSCKETHSKTDCITAVRGVSDEGYVQFLKKFAPICDRELWGIGLTCDQYQIPFKSYKLISDYAGIGTDIEKIKSRASEYSKHLFDFYKNLSLTKDSW
jgi:nucleoside phosphorylase